MTIKIHKYVRLLTALILINAVPFLKSRPSHTEHLYHLETLHFGRREEAKITNPTQSIAPENSLNVQEIIINEEDGSFLNTIKTAFTPLLAHYYFEKIIPKDPLTTTLEEQLEYVHMVSTFITRLGAKYDILPEDVRSFMKTPFAREQSITKLITKILICLQSYFAERQAAYKNLKQPTTIIKELKKLTTSTAKELDLLCKKILNLNPHEI